MSEKTYDAILAPQSNSERLHSLQRTAALNTIEGLFATVGLVRAWCIDLFPNRFTINHIRNERARQEELKATGKFAWTCADEGPLQIEKQAVLYEEIGEVAKEVVEGIIRGYADNEALYKELIQVAAVCVAWLESLEK